MQIKNSCLQTALRVTCLSCEISTNDSFSIGQKVLYSSECHFESSVQCCLCIMMKLKRNANRQTGMKPRKATSGLEDLAAAEHVYEVINKTRVIN